MLIYILLLLGRGNSIRIAILFSKKTIDTACGFSYQEGGFPSQPAPPPLPTGPRPSELFAPEWVARMVPEGARVCTAYCLLLTNLLIYYLLPCLMELRVCTA